MQHHEDKHAGQQYAIFHGDNRDKCGMCQSTSEDLTNHFKINHDAESVPMIFNPVKCSEKSVIELLKIDMKKKYQCRKCRKIFASKNEIVVHFSSAHHGEKVESKEVPDQDHQNIPDHCICGDCRKKVDYAYLSSHFWKHTYNFQCFNCPYESQDMSNLICHEMCEHNSNTADSHRESFKRKLKNSYFDSDMVFSNGLTIKTYNVLGTRFDGSKLFDISIDSFLNLMTEQAELKIKANQTEKNSTSTATSSSVPTVSQSQEVATPPVNEQRQGSVTPKLPTITDMLIEQQMYIRHVYVHGIRRNESTSSLFELCERMGIRRLKQDELSEITRLDDGLLVGFRDLKMKKWFIAQTKGKRVRSYKLFRLPRDHTPWNVYVQNYMTPYFRKMFNRLKKMNRQGRVHSFNLGENGFEVKIEANDRTEHTVQSEKQLEDLIKFGKIISTN